MRILVDICVFDLRNKGNIAMLQTAVKRIREYWPNASVEILTVGPLLLKYYFPDCVPVNPYGQQNSLSWNALQKNFHLISAPIWRRTFELRDSVRQFRSGWAMKQTNRGFNVTSNQAILIQKQELAKTTNTMGVSSDAPDVLSTEFMNEIDLFIAVGGHYLSDPVKNSALQTLERLEQASRRGIPTALVGQGMGPFEDQELLKKTKDVLPKVDLILVREKNFAPHFLESIGVSKNRILLTGDDAVEMAYQARSDLINRSNIGIGIRVASSSEVSIDHLQVIKPVLDMATTKYHAKFTPLPISDSVYESETDEKAIQKLLAGHLSKNWHVRPYHFPIDIINLVSECRIVVTGAFHPAVFALAQGIPAVCLAKSAHYFNKLSGLADIFEKGCQVIMLDDKRVKEKLEGAIDYAWVHAEELRPQLLESARCQIEWGHAGYHRIFELVESRKGKS